MFQVSSIISLLIPIRIIAGESVNIAKREYIFSSTKNKLNKQNLHLMFWSTALLFVVECQTNQRNYLSSGSKNQDITCSSLEEFTSLSCVHGCGVIDEVTTLTSPINTASSQPVNLLVREYNVAKFLATIVMLNHLYGQYRYSIYTLHRLSIVDIEDLIECIVYNSQFDEN